VVGTGKTMLEEINMEKKSENLKECNHLEILDLERKIILNWILNNGE
jgi:hypothetical protein